MSVNWNWSAKFGEMDIHQEWNGKSYDYKVEMLYANCLFCMIHIKEDESNEEATYYDFTGFFGDLEHMQKCIGLKKNYDGKYDNMWEKNENNYQWITEIRIDKDCLNKMNYRTKTYRVALELAKKFRVVIDDFKYYGKDIRK